MKNAERNNWLEITDDELVRLCEFIPFKATGRGGQKKNKSSSAVRLVHKPTDIAVTASKSRCQHTNRKMALNKLRYHIAFEVRCDTSPELTTMEMSPNNKKFYLWVAFIFDLLHRHHFAVSNCAKEIDISTSRLIKLLARDDTVWQQVNSQRKALNLTPLKK